MPPYILTFLLPSDNLTFCCAHRYAFSVTTGFGYVSIFVNSRLSHADAWIRYFNGCDGVGLDCMRASIYFGIWLTLSKHHDIGTEPNCPGPFTPPGGGPEVVSCDADNVSYFMLPAVGQHAHRLPHAEFASGQGQHRNHLLRLSYPTPSDSPSSERMACV